MQSTTDVSIQNLFSCFFSSRIGSCLKWLLNSGKTESFPVLNTTAIPLNLAGRISHRQQLLDVSRRLSTPGSVAEHYQRLRLSEIITLAIFYCTKIFG